MLVKNTDKKFARANIFFLIVAVIAREIITILDKNINLFDTLTSWYINKNSTSLL